MRAPPLIERPSPSCGPRAPGKPIDLLLLHYTGMASCAAALARLCDPAARVSAHYLIDEDGTCYRLVAEALRAWHAGASVWAGEEDVNSRSIGIELVNPGHEFGYRPYPRLQIAALTALARDILARHAIPPHRVLGHADVAPLRKQDPGELFDWQALAHAGIGLWPGAPVEPVRPTPSLGPGAAGPEVRDLQSALARFGYGVEASGNYDALTEAVVAAFQRHFRPRLVDGVADAETRSLLRHLLGRLPA